MDIRKYFQPQTPKRTTDKATASEDAKNAPTKPCKTPSIIFDDEGDLEDPLPPSLKKDASKKSRKIVKKDTAEVRRSPRKRKSENLKDDEPHSSKQPKTTKQRLEDDKDVEIIDGNTDHVNEKSHTTVKPYKARCSDTKDASSSKRVQLRDSLQKPSKTHKHGHSEQVDGKNRRHGADNFTARRDAVQSTAVNSPSPERTTAKSRTVDSRSTKQKKDNIKTGVPEPLPPSKDALPTTRSAVPIGNIPVGVHEYFNGCGNSKTKIAKPKEKHDDDNFSLLLDHSELCKTPSVVATKDKQTKRKRSDQRNLESAAPSTKVSPTKTPKKHELTLPKSAEKPVRTPTSRQPSAGAAGSAKRSSNYAFVINREGPRFLGVRPPPKGAENCLSGRTFVFSGVLDYIEKADADLAVKRHGGRVTGSVSGRTSYLVLGRDHGESKLHEAQKHKVTVINEDEFFSLIESTLPEEKRQKDKHVHVSLSTESVSHSISKQKQKSPEPLLVCESSSQQQKSEELWVEKYRPTSFKQIIGQQGDRSPASKLLYWLKNWHSGTTKPKGKSDDGLGFKAALLSGSPGVGKSTTAFVVCKELGLDAVELNASDTRNKASLTQRVSEALGSHSVAEYFCLLQDGNKSKLSRIPTSRVLIMDEVDGMSGNEDRGGIQELIALIKRASVPVICICNDRQDQKIRSLAQHCFDLKFTKPRLEQIRSAMLTIAFKEHIKIPQPAIDQIIEGSNHDIRQVLHNLSLWTSSHKTMTFDDARAEALKAKKDILLNPFEVTRLLFGGESTDGGPLGLKEKCDLFFHDYSSLPLFAQENYLSAIPHEAKNNTARLKKLSIAADSFRTADLCEKLIRSNNEWALLSQQALFSAAIPGETMKGHIGSMINFPSWFGKYSKQTRLSRLAQQLFFHMSLSTSADSRSCVLDYFPTMASVLVKPLVDGQVSPTVDVMSAYSLVRSDLDELLELNQWTNRPDIFAKVSPKVKTALTKQLNKVNALLPYDLNGATTSKRSGQKALVDATGNDDAEPEAEIVEESDNDDADAFKKPARAQPKKEAETGVSRRNNVKKPKIK